MVIDLLECMPCTCIQLLFFVLSIPTIYYKQHVVPLMLRPKTSNLPSNSNIPKIMIPSRVAFSLYFFFIFHVFVAMARRVVIPVNVGVLLDNDTWVGKMGLSCINMALSDFYAYRNMINLPFI